ncbi:MAG: hypothetical protein AAF253_10270 [Pseudomonadota bacterium]
MARRKQRKSGLVAAVCLLLATGPGACVSLGSETIRMQRGDYIDALARTNTEELLSNIVRAKYNEAPIFLKVKTVTAQPSIGIGGGAEIGIGGGDIPPPAAQLLPAFTYQQSPTIFYEPVQGKAFANELLTPTGPRPVFLMLNNGFDFSTVADLMFLSIGDISNARSTSVAERTRFSSLVAAMETLLTRRDARLGLRTDSDGQAAGFTLDFRDTAYDTAEFATLQDALSIKEGSPRIDLVSRSSDVESGTHIPFATRSLLSILNDLSAHVETPADHASWVWSGSSTRSGTPPIRIRSGERPPRGANTAIRYRGHWFWIAADDVASQNTLYLLRILFDIQAGSTGGDDSIQLVVPVQ